MKYLRYGSAKRDHVPPWKVSLLVLPKVADREVDHMRHHNEYFPIWWTVITVAVTLAMAAHTVFDRLMIYLIEF